MALAGVQSQKKYAHAMCTSRQKAFACFSAVMCCALLCQGQPFAQAEDATVEIIDEDLVKLYRLLEHPYPIVDPMSPANPTYPLTVLLREGIDPYPFLRELAFDPAAPLGKRVKSIAWLGELANPDTRKQPDPRVVPCLHELLGELLASPGIEGALEQGTFASPPLQVLINSVFNALSRTKDESSVDLILPLTTAEFWASARAPEIRLLSSENYPQERHWNNVVNNIRTRGLYAIARSGTERSLEVFGAGDQIDFTGMKMGNAREKYLDSLLEEAIQCRADIRIIPEDPATLPEEKRRELEEIRQRVDTQYLPLRKDSGEQETDGR